MLMLLQVGAAAVGGGALFAVTGGLAAPAIAAGMASILGFIGAPTAIAGTVTGFLASTAGGAAARWLLAVLGSSLHGATAAGTLLQAAQVTE